MRTTSISTGLVATLCAVGLVSAQATTISPNCAAKMQELDGDKTLGDYLSPILKVTKNSDKATLLATLNSLCSASQQAQQATAQSTIKTYLNDFWTACTAEIQNPPDNPTPETDARSIYDILYLLTPFQNSICSKDSSTGDYCVQHIGDYTRASSKRSLDARQASTSSAVDNGAAADTLQTADDNDQPNFAYLFLTPTMDKSVLCSSCTPQILRSYIKFNMQSPYAIGLSRSDLFGGQHALYNAVNQQCGNATMSQINTEDVIGKFLVTQSGASQIRGSMTVLLLASIAVTSALVVSL